jgi:DNA-directed RNA polymerase subunit RPC12/RpoP
MTNPCCPSTDAGQPQYGLSTTSYRCRVCSSFASGLYPSGETRVRRLRCEKCGHETNHDPYCLDSENRCIRFVEQGGSEK